MGSNNKKRFRFDSFATEFASEDNQNDKFINDNHDIPDDDSGIGEYSFNLVKNVL